jgi:hypothetical protein
VDANSPFKNFASPSYFFFASPLFFGSSRARKPLFFSLPLVFFSHPAQPSPSLFFLSFFSSSSFTLILPLPLFFHLLPFFSPTPTEREREREREQIVRERESCAVKKKKKKKREKRGFWRAPSRRHLRLRSTIIRGPMELKFCREVHNT